MQPEPPARGGFFLNVNIVLLSQVAIYGLAFTLRVVLAHGLGDSGLGTYSLVYITVLVAGGIANLGVGLGNIYFLNTGTHGYLTLLSTSLFLLAAASGGGWLLILGYAAIFGDDLFVSGTTYWLYAVALPAVIAYVLLTSFLHGSSRFYALSSVAIAQSFLGVLFVGVLDLRDDLTVKSAVASWAASFLIADVLALALVGVRNVDLGAVLQPDWGVLRNQVRYGAQGQLANLAQLFNYRLDQYLVAAFTTRADVGHYAVAVGIAESVWWLSSAVAMVLLPRLTGMERGRADELTPLICRNTLFASVLGSAAIMAVSPVAIRLVFGRDFDPAVAPLLLLMPGIVAASATRVLGSYLFSQGRIIYNTYATLIALGLTIALDLVLIPLIEVPGAALASSIAYTASMVATVYWYTRVSGQSAVDALVFRPSDVRHYIDIVERLRNRRSGNGAALAADPDDALK